MMEFVGYVYYIMRMFVCISDLWIVYEILFFEGVCVVMYENCIKVNWIQFVEFIYQLFNMKCLRYYEVRYSEYFWIELNDKVDKDLVLK